MGLGTITREDTEVGKWYKDTYVLRNRVVHSGYMPIFNETKNAISHAIELKQHVMKLLRTKVVKYPKINSYFS